MTRAAHCSVIALTILFALGIVLPAVPASAATTAVQCGQTITHDVRLTADLTNCPADGLIIGADNVRLDLNGHAITGAPHGFIDCFGGGGPPGPCVGIFTNEHVGLTITNGAISDFDTGIGGVGAGASSHDRITRLRLTGNTNDDISVGDDNVVSFNEVTRPVVVVSRSEVSHNTATGDGAFVAFVGDQDRIEWNVIHSGTVESPNIDLHDATNSYVGNNWLLDGGLAVEGHSDSSTVTSNVLVRSHIFVGGSTGVTVSGNVILRTPDQLTLDGIRVGFDPSSGGTDRVNVSRNVIFGAGNDGIAVDYSGAATNTRIRDNVVWANHHDGIENGDSTATLARNTAIRNPDFGIESVPGAIDGGGNRAAGNGNPEQCANVTCR